MQEKMSIFVGLSNFGFDNPGLAAHTAIADNAGMQKKGRQDAGSRPA